MIRKRVTIRDVAREAAVSMTSVSRHLNGQITLPEATARRIERAVETLGYAPNALARQLSLGASRTLGFVTSDIAYPFFAAIASAAEDEAARQGYGLMIFNSRNRIEQELAQIERIANHQIDGLILQTNHPADPALAEAINATGRVVLIDEDVPGALAPRLFARNAEGGELATRHLLDHGHRHIGMICGPDGMSSSIGRKEGHARAMARAGLLPSPGLILHGAYDEDSGARAFRHLMERPHPPTALFATADVLALGALRAARDMGLSIPRDVSLISFDDIPNADLLAPPLTTIRQSPEDFGRGGIRLLLELIQDGSVLPRQEHVPVSIIERASVSAPGPEDPPLPRAD
ncbi:LacI family transcriptional regulator [Pseudooceanicola sp. CBS1P-1]|uniref:Substrate-binding domain-containing protein n=1 Tax=Pseudooceanicola albus TaxID=2692189 RepID=A0A6L7GC26_9RHOB|nr:MULTISPECIES: LacI family DNA-binding transcriptional regulator [Pseudooceanicola]MBT9386304.1 LacI family transcriptional regulator [Pseudooceanicola endophyticus]MXN20353.1 substrate-binding domain-containing protein [Pseudooceanicola albus]